MGRMDDDVDKDNAALIVRAVNRDHLFGELVKLLQEIMHSRAADYAEANHPGWFADATALLAKVKEAGHG